MEVPSGGRSRGEEAGDLGNGWSPSYESQCQPKPEHRTHMMLSQSIYIRSAGVGLGGLLLLSGISGYISPLKSLSQMGLDKLAPSISTKSSDSHPAAKSQTTLIASVARFVAARNVYNGVCMLGLAYFGEWKALGGLYCAAPVVTLLDGWTTRGSVNPAFVAGVCAVMLGVGTSLLGAWDGDL